MVRTQDLVNNIYILNECLLSSSIPAFQAIFFPFSVEKQTASLPLLVSPPLCWQHEGNFYAIITAEKEVFMLSKTQSTLLQCTQGSAQALKLNPQPNDHL